MQPTRPGDALVALAFVLLAVLGAAVFLGFLYEFIAAPFFAWLCELPNRFRRGPPDP